MWIVATESIDEGAEIRINYEAGEAQEYWLALGGAPKETAEWREVRAPLVGPQVPCDATPAVGVLDAIRETAKRNRGHWQLPPAILAALSHAITVPSEPLPVPQADERIRMLAPLLARSDNLKTWGLLATHVPGWNGRECRKRWVAMGKHPPLQDHQQYPVAADGRRRTRATVASTILRTMQ